MKEGRDLLDFCSHLCYKLCSVQAGGGNQVFFLFLSLGVFEVPRGPYAYSVLRGKVNAAASLDIFLLASVSPTKTCIKAD